MLASMFGSDFDVATGTEVGDVGKLLHWVVATELTLWASGSWSHFDIAIQITKPDPGDSKL